MPKRRVQYVAESCFAVTQDNPEPVLGPKQMLEAFHKAVPNAEKEHFVALYLNSSNVPLLLEIVSIGTLDQCPVHPREVFCPAVRVRAASVLVAHNHPSGDPSPSPEDIGVTSRLINAGKLLGIELLDHVVIAGESWVSIREHMNKDKSKSGPMSSLMRMLQGRG